MRRITIERIKRAVESARTRHPEFSEGNNYKMFTLLGEEKGELAEALNERDLVQAKAEALDCIAVLVRFLEDD